MTQAVFKLGNTGLVTGMHWETFETTQADENLLLTLAKELGATKYISRANWFKQVGFATIPLKQLNAKHISLAAAVQLAATRAALPPNWLGIFELGGGDLWMVAVAESAILPESDFAGPALEVEQHFVRFAALREWEAVVIPARLRGTAFVQVARTVHEVELSDWVSLGDINNDRWLSACLLTRTDANEVRRRQTWQALFVAGMLLAATFVAYFVWEKASAADVARVAALQAEGQRKANVAAAAAKAAVVAAAGSGVATAGAVAVTAAVDRVVKMQTPTWESLPPVAVFAKLCSMQLSALPSNPAGWSLTIASCDGSSVSASYLRGSQGAPVRQFIARMPNAVIKPDGESAEWVLPLAAMPRGRDEALLTFEEASLRLVDRFQVLGVKVPVRELPLPANAFRAITAIPDKFPVTESPVIQSWRTLAFFLTTTLPPTLLTKALDLPGLRLRSIRMSMPPISGGGAGASPQVVYTVDGEMYVN